MVVILLLTVSTNTNNGCEEYLQNNRGYATKSSTERPYPLQQSHYFGTAPISTRIVQKQHLPCKENTFHLYPPSQKNSNEKIYENTCAECCKSYPTIHVNDYEADQIQTKALFPKTPAYAAACHQHNQSNEHAQPEPDANVLKYAQANLIPKPPRGKYFNNNNNNKGRNALTLNAARANSLVNSTDKLFHKATKDYAIQHQRHTQQQPHYENLKNNYTRCRKTYNYCDVSDNGVNNATNSQCSNCNNNNNNTNNTCDYTRYITRVNFYEINTSQVDSFSNAGSTSSIETNTKEEEWITKKKTELITTKQIETRVQRELLFEDGKVVEDSGAIVSTNTTEDTDKKESETTEKRDFGQPENKSTVPAIEAGTERSTTFELSSLSNNFNPIDKNILLREINAKRVISHEVTDDLLETEVVKHYGDVVDEDYVDAVNSGVENLENHLISLRAKKDTKIAEPKVLANTTQSKKIIDTEDINKRWLGQIDGTIVTEEKKTTEHEIIADRDLPDADDKSTGSREHVNTVQATQRFFKKRDENHVDLLANGQVVGSEMRYAAETVQMEKEGSLERLGDWDSLSERVRRQRRAQQKALLQQQKDRKDALTKRPLDFDLEEETRKGETMKWLESHFGSDSNGSVDSQLNDTAIEPTKKTYFNVTIKSNHAQMSPIPEQTTEHRKLPTADTYVSRDDIITQKRKSLSLQFLTDPERIHSNTYVRDPTKHKKALDTQQNYHKQTALIEERPFIHVSQFDGGKTPNYLSQRSLQNLSEKRSTSDTKSYYHSNSQLATPNNGKTLERPVVPQRRRNANRSLSNQLNSISQTKLNLKLVAQNELIEPPPDYSPPSRHERAASFEDASPTSIISINQPINQQTLSRKQQQNTRFVENVQETTPPQRYNMTTQTSNANITLTPTPPPPVPSKSNRVSQAIGNSIRKLVDKLRSASAERKLRKKSRSKSRERSPVSTKGKDINDTTTTYQQYNVIDSYIDEPYNYDNKKPIAEKSLRRSSQDSEKYGNEHFRGIKIERDNTQPNEQDMENVHSPRQRYYLGEDPYTSTLRRTENEPKYNEQPVRPYKEYGYRSNQKTSYTLGRNPKNSHITGSMPQLHNDLQASQTLPRKLHQRHQSEQPQYARNRTSITFADKHILKDTPAKRTVHQEYAPPSKPMRMPPTNSLIRSKSLNFNALNGENDATYYDNSSRTYDRQPYKSTVNLYKSSKDNTLQDSSLKSPSIVNLISRSQKDLSRIGLAHEHDNEINAPPLSKHTNTMNRYNNKSTLKQQIENAHQLRQYRENNLRRNDEINRNKVHQHLQRTQSSIAQPSSTLDFVKDQASIIRRGSTDDYIGHYQSSAKQIEMPYRKQSIQVQDTGSRRPAIGELRKLYHRK